MSKRDRRTMKFGYMSTNDGFSLIAQNTRQARLLAEIASIRDDRISSFGPVTPDDSLTTVLFIESRNHKKEKKRKRAARPGQQGGER